MQFMCFGLFVPYWASYNMHMLLMEAWLETQALESLCCLLLETHRIRCYVHIRKYPVLLVLVGLH